MKYLALFLLGYLFRLAVDRLRPRKHRVHRRREHGPRRSTVTPPVAQDVQATRRRCAAPSNPRKPGAVESDVVSALVNFGLRKTEAQKTVAAVGRPDLPFEELFKMATVRATGRAMRLN